MFDIVLATLTFGSGFLVGMVAGVALVVVVADAAMESALTAATGDWGEE